jgi:proline dehydrogenase
MIRRTWQSGMITLARSQTAKATMQRWGAASVLASRFVAGATAEEAVARAAALHAKHSIRGSLFYLGEYVDRTDLVAENVSAKLAVAALLGRTGLDVHVSVDPTQIGHSLDPAKAQRNAFTIAEAVHRAACNRPGVHALMLDMEDQSVVDATIALHDAIKSAGLPAALTLQAYLRRTEADIRAQIRRGTRLRLVKGAFAAGSEIAFTRRFEVKANSRRLIDLMFSRDARDAGFYPILATHDDRLQAYALERAGAAGWRADEYEFEMLLGVRNDVAEDLARRGERVRLYLPFGRDWWPYAVRRIGENPRNAMLLLRALVGSTRSRQALRQYSRSGFNSD